MFDLQIFIIIDFFFHHFYRVNIQYCPYFIHQKKIQSQNLAKFKAFHRHDVVFQKKFKL